MESLGVHLLAGLPTDAVRWGFERAGERMPVVPLDGLVDAAVGDATRIGVLLPPFVEPSLLVESWEDCEFLPQRFGLQLSARLPQQIHRLLIALSHRDHHSTTVPQLIDERLRDTFG